MRPVPAMRGRGMALRPGNQQGNKNDKADWNQPDP